ncbi:MAG: redoxin family protein [Candidatus Poribacteria bacterium]|nr:redoxin family protein [Candidatus Poribacteria bacterium]
MKGNSADLWEDFLLKSQRDADGKRKVAKDIQEKVITYIKAKIDAGVSNGKTSLPSDLMEYIYRFSKEMRQELREYAENVLEKNPDNGAAAKFLAIETLQKLDGEPIPIEPKYPYLEKAMVLVPKDVEICFFAFEEYGCDQFLHEMEDYEDDTLVSIERLFDRIHERDTQTQSRWVRMLYDYSEVWTSPTDIYKTLNENDPYIKRWTAVLCKIQNVFEQELERTPNDWEIVLILTEIHAVLGNTDAAEKVLRKAQTVFEKRLEQTENDQTALDGLANIHEKLGNAELAQEYKLKADPSLGWVDQILPNFPASTVDLDDNSISLADYRGKVVLLDFWAVWCGPCVGEIPNIKEVYEKYHDKGFDVIGVSFDKDEAVVREFIKEKEIPWRQILDSGGFKGIFAEQYGVRGIPAPFLIDRKGKVISVKARGSLLGELVAAEIEDK